MKRTLLIFSLCAAMFGSKATAQDLPAVLTVFDEVVFYGMYDGPVNTPVPEGTVRSKNWSYGKKLTEEQIAVIGNRLTINVLAEALCDDYDRIGNVNLAFVPKNSTSYVYEDVMRIEVGRFITPFMNNITQTPTQVPYTFEADNIAQILHDPILAAEYDFWFELEIYGHQGGPSADQGGAQWDFLSTGLCNNRNDVYKGTLELVTENDPDLVLGENHFEWLSYKFELKDYVQATETNNMGQGTDELDETVRTINFDFGEEVQNAKFYVVVSNHGSFYSTSEEYRNILHYVYLDNVEKLRFRPGRDCEPYRVYNTMGNGVYGPSVRPLNYWTGRAWCPGAKIETRVVELGTLAAGQHSYKMNVPSALFTNDHGYFPMSVYVQGYSDSSMSSKGFKANNISVYPNPVNNIATISANGQQIKNVSVINALGQTVLQTKSDKVDMTNLQKGIYVVQVEFDNNQIATKKIVKN
ncbi:T9SS type A sorting domain-containing protein [Flavobacterium sp. Sd200]|uniref:peptide-N-glycosidase F-related protein n=1 Tax=Flavobacterium sp. Sd200 TaxID=2692211 RepID=UPI001367F150|nr:peptide-N-glycosidase F-related protein [Flavobacterium sp. Sd200]MXN92203.1 T9SS type A sorting domain-containing protein [Flavobacterium sp. Sd200]